jgi:hypothetical protein
MNPTVDSMMAAMGWERVLHPVMDTSGSMSYVMLPHVPIKYPSSRRLAPRWQVPAIKRRKAGH